MNKIIAYCLLFVITGIVIYRTHGRISQKRYWIIETMMIVGCILVWAFAIVMLLVFHNRLFYILASIASPFYFYKHAQLQFLRYHDLNYSGWYCLLNLIPFVGLYFWIIRIIKPRTDLINEFDEPLDYLKFMKKTKLYP